MQAAESIEIQAVQGYRSRGGAGQDIAINAFFRPAHRSQHVVLISVSGPVMLVPVWVVQAVVGHGSHPRQGSGTLKDVIDGTFREPAATRWQHAVFVGIGGVEML